MNAPGLSERIASGTTVLLRALPGLVWAGEWRESIARWALAGITGSIGITAMALHWWLIPGAIALWCAVASAVPLPEAEEEEDPDEEEEAAGEQEPDDEDPDGLLDPDAFRELLADCAQGRNVHLTTVREQLAEETGREWSGPQARALCAAADVRVRDGVRVPGARPAVTTGIHRDDLPPLPSVVSAGQHSNNNTNTTTEHVGQGGLIVKHGPSTRQGIRR